MFQKIRRCLDFVFGVSLKINYDFSSPENHGTLKIVNICTYNFVLFLCRCYNIANTTTGARKQTVNRTQPSAKRGRG
jgi:hypothetical protein